MARRCARATSRWSDSSNNRRLARPVSESRVAKRSFSPSRRALRNASAAVHRRLGEGAHRRGRDAGIVPPPHSPTATPSCSPSAVMGVTTTLRAPGSTRSSKSSSTTRTSIDVPLDHTSSTRGAGWSDTWKKASATPSSRTPSHTGPERTRTTARVKPSREHAWRTKVVSTSSGRMARSSSVPSSTSCSRWPRLLRSARSLMAENNAAHTAKSRKAIALTMATRSSSTLWSSTAPASAAACRSSNSSAHHTASFRPVRYDATSVTAITSRNTRKRSGLR